MSPGSKERNGKGERGCGGEGGRGILKGGFICQKVSQRRVVVWTKQLDGMCLVCLSFHGSSGETGNSTAAL